jgi:hypothetical protein
MTRFRLETDALALPGGAYAKTTRRWLSRDGKRILALTDGPFRPYLFPLFSPAGYLLTSESPADHPHHNSLWLGSDHVHLLNPVAAGKHEEYTYNFYVNETFQGRSPGRQIEIDSESGSLAADRFGIRQQIEWRGPPEWAAPDGRLILRESRMIEITPGRQFHRIDITASLSAAGPTVRLGPTRHAFFNARVAETIPGSDQTTIVGPAGPLTPAAIAANGAAWVDFTGPVGGGARAGITLLPHPVGARDNTWFVADWGVMTAGAFRAAGVLLRPGSVLRVGCTYLLHDGDIPPSLVEAIAADLPAGVFPEREDHQP